MDKKRPTQGQYELLLNVLQQHGVTVEWYADGVGVRVHNKFEDSLGEFARALRSALPYELR